MCPVTVSVWIWVNDENRSRVVVLQLSISSQHTKPLSKINCPMRQQLVASLEWEHLHELEGVRKFPPTLCW
jgi:hypothetical protein